MKDNNDIIEEAKAVAAKLQHKVDVREPLFSEDCVKMADTVRRLAAELAKAREAIAKLPKTADGVPIVPGMEVWRNYEWRQKPVANIAVMTCASIAEHGPEEMIFCQDYSTEEAAAIAKEAE